MSSRNVNRRTKLTFLQLSYLNDMFISRGTYLARGDILITQEMAHSIIVALLSRTLILSLASLLRRVLIICVRPGKMRTLNSLQDLEPFIICFNFLDTCCFNVLILQLTFLIFIPPSDLYKTIKFNSLNEH